MFRSFRFFLSCVAVVSMASGAFAVGSSTPADYVPDPALQKASMRQLQTRVAKACVVIQTRDQQIATREATQKCGCYANRTLKSLSPEELQEYRNTGVFNYGARNKAYAALNECGLPKP